MSTLDPHGMVTPYKVDRTVTFEEERGRLLPKLQASEKIHYELALTRINSTFVESVDKWYAMRGFVAMGCAGLLCLFGCGIALIALFLSVRIDFVSIGLLIVGLLGFMASGYLFTRDAFTYTHYPIRFNRKTKQVYVFRRDGSVLKANWYDIYWTIYGHNVGLKDLYVVGHIMGGTDGKTVKETFALSCVSAGRLGQAKLTRHFEFFRRYMEDGPEAVLQALKPTPLIMLPRLDLGREDWKFGWQRLTLHENGSLVGMILYQVIAFPQSFFRWMVMRTSKIPQWPQWVLDECAIEANDPWIRDGERPR